VQIISVRIAAIGDIKGLTLTPRDPAGATAPQPASEREVYIDGTHGYRACPAYDRGAIEPGMSIEGPALVDQLDTTIFIRPGWKAVADAYESLVASRTGAPA
jgi:N-methylhydantoinase A